MIVLLSPVKVMVSRSVSRHGISQTNGFLSSAWWSGEKRAWRKTRSLILWWPGSWFNIMLCRHSAKWNIFCALCLMNSSSFQLWRFAFVKIRNEVFDWRICGKTASTHHRMAWHFFVYLISHLGTKRTLPYFFSLDFFSHISDS